MSANKFTQAMQMLQEDKDQRQGKIHQLENKIARMERELKTPRQHDARIADQGRIIGEQSEVIRRLKAQNKRQAASLRAAKEALI